MRTKTKILALFLEFENKSLIENGYDGFLFQDYKFDKDLIINMKKKEEHQQKPHILLLLLLSSCRVLF